MNKQNFQIYKLFNGKWSEIDIKNIRKNDIIKIIDIDTNLPLLNKESGEVDIVTCDAYKDENNGWSIQSKPYKLKEEK